MRPIFSAIRGWYPLQRCFSNKGYTILEVLIAIAIFTAMVTIASMALNQGLGQYHRLMERGINFWDNAKYLWINKSLNSAVDYYVYSRDSGWFPYFRGNQELISYVSSSPLATDEPVVVWIRNERQDDGNRSIVYYELPVYAKNMQEIERQYLFGDFKKGNSITLLKGIGDVSIKFYGYDLLEKQWSWTGDFDGSKRKVLPQAIKIDYKDMGTGERKTVILGINTNSLNKMIYNEGYLPE